MCVGHPCCDDINCLCLTKVVRISLTLELKYSEMLKEVFEYHNY